MPPVLATDDHDHRSDEVAPSCFSCLLGMLNTFRKKRNYTRARPSPSTFRQDRERVLHRTSPFTVTANVETSSSRHSAAMSYRPPPRPIRHQPLPQSSVASQLVLRAPIAQPQLCWNRRLDDLVELLDTRTRTLTIVPRFVAMLMGGMHVTGWSQGGVPQLQQEHWVHVVMQATSMRQGHRSRHTMSEGGAGLPRSANAPFRLNSSRNSPPPTRIESSMQAQAVGEPPPPPPPRLLIEGAAGRFRRLLDPAPPEAEDGQAVKKETQQSAQCCAFDTRKADPDPIALPHGRFRLSCLSARVVASCLPKIFSTLLILSDTICCDYLHQSQLDRVWC